MSLFLQDLLHAHARKLRTRGADGKAAETATSKRRKREQWNQGYVFGAYFSIKAGYRVEGDDKVTLSHDDCQLDCFEITKGYESLQRRTKFGLKTGPTEATPERRSARRTRLPEDEEPS